MITVEKYCPKCGTIYSVTLSEENYSDLKKDIPISWEESKTRDFFLTSFCENCFRQQIFLDV